MNHPVIPRAAAIGALALSLSASLADAQAQPGRNCGSRDQVVERLAEKFGETQRSIGLGANNSMVELFASDRTGSWTITMTNAHGVTCLVASGMAFETTLPATRDAET